MCTSRVRRSKRTGSSRTVPLVSIVPPSGVPALRVTVAGPRLGQVNARAVRRIGFRRKTALGSTVASSSRTRPFSTETSPTSIAKSGGSALGLVAGAGAGRSPFGVFIDSTSSEMVSRPSRSRPIRARGRLRRTRSIFAFGHCASRPDSSTWSAAARRRVPSDTVTPFTSARPRTCGPAGAVSMVRSVSAMPVNSTGSEK